ncbi:MAG: tripartite tricarboxylate transporter TctB family protein [Desulfobacteraceae bacterium]|nr:MAG: tripartite tricarboxylate transporter TctB family protein [Desulfobacteraceae bacterium]
MQKADRISGIFWLIFSVAVMIASYKLGLGSLRRPGSGFFFFWAGSFMAILALIVFVQSWAGRKTKDAPESLFRGRNILKIALVLASVILYALFIERLGFVAVTFLLFLFLLGFMERKGSFFTILTSLLVTASAYVIFKVLLKSQLPTGWLGL